MLLWPYSSHCYHIAVEANMDNNNQYINPAMLMKGFTDHGESLPMQHMQPPPQQVASQEGSPSLGLVSQQEVSPLPGPEHR